MKLSDEDRKKLEKFQKQAEKVLNSALIKSGWKPSMYYSSDQKRIIINIEVIEDHLKALLVDFRPLISKKESVFIPKIFNLIEQPDLDPRIVEMIHQIHVEREAAQKLEILQGSDGTEYNEKEMFDLILNSEYMHLDENKAEAFKKLTDLGKEVGFLQFLKYIHQEVSTISKLHNAVALILEENK